MYGSIGAKRPEARSKAYPASTSSTRSLQHSLPTSGPRFPRQHGFHRSAANSCSRRPMSGRRGETRPNLVTTSSARRSSTTKPGAGFAMRLVLRPFMRTQTTPSGWCQRLRSSNPSRIPVPRARDARARTGSTSSVGSATGRPHIDSANSKLSLTMSGPVSQCGSARCVERPDTGRNLKQISREYFVSFGIRQLYSRCANCRLGFLSASDDFLNGMKDTVRVSVTRLCWYRCSMQSVD